MIRLYVFIVFTLLSVSFGYAQEVLVCDAVTRLPIRDVATIADGKPVGKTNYKGLITLPEGFQEASFKCKSYISEKLKREEVLRDTVLLYPAEHYLDEVIVQGHHIINGKETLAKMSKRDILEQAPPRELGGFDFGLMFDKRLRRDKAHVEKQRKIFAEMDGTNAEDPILKAYNGTKLKQQEEENKKKAQGE